MIFYRIDFDDPQFRKGFNTTLRLGRKHHTNITKILEKTAERVVLSLCETGTENVIAFGTLRSIECLYWDQLSITECATNHIARDKDSLKRAMENAYAKIITDNDELTMIGFDIMHENKDDDNDGGEDIINTPPTPSLLSV